MRRVSAQTRFASDLLRRLQEGSALGSEAIPQFRTCRKFYHRALPSERRSSALDPLKNGPASIVLDKKQVESLAGAAIAVHLLLDLPPGLHGPRPAPGETSACPSQIGLGRLIDPRGAPTRSLGHGHGEWVPQALPHSGNSSVSHCVWDDGPDPRYGPATWTWLRAQACSDESFLAVISLPAGWCWKTSTTSLALLASSWNDVPPTTTPNGLDSPDATSLSRLMGPASHGGREPG